MTTTAVFAPLVKWDKNADGTINAFGRATSDDLDLDRQVCDPTWLAEAMPAWFKSAANVREQHSSIAAGVGTELTQNGNGWDLRSLVVDPGSAKKVELGVLKGYSIGIRNPKVIKDASAPGGRICGGEIVEVSLVDRPANPTCTLTLAKALKPSPDPVAPGAVDIERHLVKVEELHDRSDEVLVALKALDGDLVKGDNGRDIATAQQAISSIAGLIQHEAECLADGMTSEACDIELLLSAVRSLEWFICREKKEPTMAHVELSAETDTTKAAESAPPTEQAPETAPVVEKAAEPADGGSETGGNAPQTDLTELVEAAVAKAVGPIQEQLAKALAAPAPGGPVLTRTTEDTDKAANREADLAMADHYKRLADQMVSDPGARQAYLNKASTLRAAATS
jgi:hypothetical protein